MALKYQAVDYDDQLSLVLRLVMLLTSTTNWSIRRITKYKELTSVNDLGESRSSFGRKVLALNALISKPAVRCVQGNLVAGRSPAHKTSTLSGLTVLEPIRADLWTSHGNMTTVESAIFWHCLQGVIPADASADGSY